MGTVIEAMSAPATVPTLGTTSDVVAEIVERLLEVAVLDPDGFEFAVGQVTETTDLLLRLAAARRGRHG